MRARCGSRPCVTPGTLAIRCQASSRRSRIYRSTNNAAESGASLRPIGDRLGAADDRPPVGAVLMHAVAVLARRVFPGGAEAVGRKLPGALGDDGTLGLARLASGPAERFARHGAVRLEHHAELDVRGGRCRERLAVEERRLDVLGSEPSDRCCDYKAGAEKERHRGARDPYPHRCPPATLVHSQYNGTRVCAMMREIWTNFGRTHSIGGSTGSGGVWQSRNVRMFTMTSPPMSMRPSSVAEPMCGKTTTLPVRASFMSLGLTAGACSNTSRPAPAMSPAAIRRASAFSSITSPRAVLTT